MIRFWTFRAYSRLASEGISLAKFVSPTIVTSSWTTVSPGFVSSQLPPVAAARSTITEPARIARTALAGINFGAGRPGIAAVVITASEVRQALLELGLLLCLLLRGQFLRVAALGLLAAHAEVEELRAERLDLLADDVADVEAPRHCAEAARGRERLQPATPAPITSTFAGCTVPAAVVSIGRKRGRLSAAISVAL